MAHTHTLQSPSRLSPPPASSPHSNDVNKNRRIADNQIFRRRWGEESTTRRSLPVNEPNEWSRTPEIQKSGAQRVNVSDTWENALVDNCVSSTHTRTIFCCVVVVVVGEPLFVRVVLYIQRSSQLHTISLCTHIEWVELRLLRCDRGRVNTFLLYSRLLLSEFFFILTLRHYSNTPYFIRVVHTQSCNPTLDN